MNRKTLLRKKPTRLTARWTLLGLLLLLVFSSVQSVRAQTGYIYVHKRALSEDSSPNFPFTVSGGTTTITPFTLNDQPTTFKVVYWVGGDASGGLWALAASAADANGNYTVYYRAPNSSTWVLKPGGGDSIDGGAAGTFINTTAQGSVSYYNGTTTTDVQYNLPGTPLSVSDNWLGVQYAATDNSEVWKRTIPATSWTKIPNITSVTIDAIPNTNKIVYVSNNELAVRTANNDGTGLVNLGNPDGSTATLVSYVSATGDGTIYAKDGRFVYRYTGSAWVKEPESLDLSTITGGPASQMWGVIPSTGANVPMRIYSRAETGNWISDENVRTSANDNATLLAVAPGTYTITEGAVAGWKLNDIAFYETQSPSTKNLASRTATVVVSAGEVAHVVFENQVIQSTSLANVCGVGNNFTETFGTGTGYGGPLTGLTSYHFNSAGGDYGYGYYALINNSDLMGGGPGGYAVSSPDHTGNANGRMLGVDATSEPGIFYRRQFTNVTVGASYDFSAWAMSVNNQGATDVPNVSFEVYDPATGTLLNSSNTGNITTVGVWQKSSLVFNATQSTIDLVLRNNTLGTSGNDLAIDDVSFGLAVPTAPVVVFAQAGCATPTASLTVISPLGAFLEYSINGTTYQTNTVFTGIAVPTSFTATARYIGSTCVSPPTAVTLNSAICGNVFNDANGLTDNTVNGTGVNGPSVGGAPLYVSLVSGGAVIATVPVTSTGTYSFTNVAAGSYSVVLTTNAAGSVTPSLPASWTSTGENIGTAAGNDGTSNGILPVTVGTTSVSNANLAIEQRPTVTPGTNAAQANPGGSVAAPVSPSLFTGTDPEDGTYPTNLTGRTVTLTPATNGTLFYNGTAVTTTTVISSFDPTKVTLDPTATGATTGSSGAAPDPTFTYTVKDNAGVESLPATIRVPFTAALPVSLVSFTAKAQADQSVLLEWITSLETKNKGFLIERSKDLTQFEKVGEVSEVAASSNALKTYHLIDAAPYSGTSYYRLSQTDLDGTTTRYPAISVVVRGEAYGIFPNPVKDGQFTLNLDEPLTATVNLYTVDGRPVGLQKGATTASSLHLKATQPLATGVYVLSVQERGQTRQYRIVIN